MSMKQAGEASSMSLVIDEIKNFCRECWKQMRGRHMKVYRVRTCGVSSLTLFYEPMLRINEQFLEA